MEVSDWNVSKVQKESKHIALVLVKFEICKAKTLKELSALHEKYLPLFSRNRSKFSTWTKHTPSSLPVFLQDIEDRRAELTLVAVDVTVPSAPPLVSSEKSAGLEDASSAGPAAGGAGLGIIPEASAPPIDFNNGFEDVSCVRPNNSDASSVSSEDSVATGEDEAGDLNNISVREASSSEGSDLSSITASFDRRIGLTVAMAVSDFGIDPSPAAIVPELVPPEETISYAPTQEPHHTRTAGCFSLVSALAPNVQAAQTTTMSFLNSLRTSATQGFARVKDLADLDNLLP